MNFFYLKYFIGCCLLLIITSIATQAQSTWQYSNRIKITKNSQLLTSAWQGGLWAVTFRQANFYFDGNANFNSVSLTELQINYVENITQKESINPTNLYFSLVGECWSKFQYEYKNFNNQFFNICWYHQNNKNNTFFFRNTQLLKGRMMYVGIFYTPIFYNYNGFYHLGRSLKDSFKNYLNTKLQFATTNYFSTFIAQNVKLFPIICNNVLHIIGFSETFFTFKALNSVENQVFTNYLINDQIILAGNTLNKGLYFLSFYSKFNKINT